MKQNTVNIGDLRHLKRKELQLDENLKNLRGYKKENSKESLNILSEYFSFVPQIINSLRYKVIRKCLRKHIDFKKKMDHNKIIFCVSFLSF